MNKHKRPWIPEDVDYWKSMVDIIFGLLLIILLIMVLLVLGILDTEKGEGEYTEVEPSPTVTVTPTPTPTPTPSPTPAYNWGGGGGGGGGGYDTWYTPTPSPTPSPTPALAEYEKSAVRVMVYDSESEQLLTEKSASFNVLENDKKMTLYVRYPEVIGYSTFSTEDKGSFFLPEKLIPGEYELKNSRLIEDYDLPDKLKFILEEGHDWDDPFIVKVDAVPCRNIIRLTVTDAETGEPVSGGNYYVIAERDVVGGDGEIRYSAEEIVDTLHGSRKGIATSAELYLGDFRVEQGEPAFGYADEGETAKVTLKRRQSMDEVTDVQIKVNRTKFVLTVRDGANYNRLQGVKFLVTGDSGLTECVTDVNGQITLVNLEKNAEYSVVQAESYQDYQYDPEPITFTVDEKGLIENSATLSVERTENRIVCTFALRGKLLPIVPKGQKMQLINADGKVIKEWTSAAEAETISGIQPGSYTLKAGEMETEITVENISDAQSFEIRAWQTLEYVAFAGVALAIVLIVVLVLIINKKRRQ